MKDFIPTNSSLRTGMLIKNKLGHFGIVLLNNEKYAIGRVSGNTWFPIYNKDKCFIDETYFHEIWSENSNNADALNLSTDNRTLLWKRKIDPKIKVAEYDVKFEENYIKVGCTTVTHEEIETVYNHIFNNKEK